MERFLDYSLQVLKQFTEGKGRNLGLTDFGIFCGM
jgi:hypothetical protein